MRARQWRSGEEDRFRVYVEIQNLPKRALREKDETRRYRFLALAIESHLLRRGTRISSSKDCRFPRKCPENIVADARVGPSMSSLGITGLF